MILVPPQDLANVWPHCERWIEEAVKVNQGDENTLDVLIALARNQYLLWWEPGQFAAVVQVCQFPRQKVATVLYLGGHLEQLPKLFEEGKTWCKANGISVIRTFGREGWQRAIGLKRVGVILQTEV